MDEKEIKKYWETRASENKNNVAATTNDVYLRELEIRTFCNQLEKTGLIKGQNVLDIGCGDGYTTLNVARNFPDVEFIGVDYAENMIANAQRSLQTDFQQLKNVKFKVADATNISESFDASSFDVILTDRCLINLKDAAIQYQTIKQICSLLKSTGLYLAIENFVEGNNNLNEARKQMGLNEIPIRWHNLFFKEDEFIDTVKPWFSSVKFIEFSSAYYFATRVIYSAICKLQNAEPDYLNDIHKISIDLPVYGKFSPIRLIKLKK
jgi:ubiquinone/menaquinone biosynthesis C-methylase UbiE